MTLVLPPRLTASAKNLRDAAQRRGLHTIQLPTFEVPAGTRADHLHAGPTFADAVAPILGIAPLEAPPDWLTGLPRELTHREITLVTAGEAYELRRPAFIKSPNDKSIRAMIYTDGSRLPGPDAIDRQTPVLVSDIVDFAAEYRLHLLDGAVHTASQYAEQGRLRLGPPSADTLAFGADLLAGFGHTLPTAIVVDVGVVDGHWAVIEPNAAWASGAYVADPDLVLDVILRAAGPTAGVSSHDRRFIRAPQQEQDRD
ncbi:ATP-grasp domain-containing protein [Micromonospora sp. NBC_01796]|uniref:ATP-grasp domain-containing protein n=1 Tax=Micromonospora sp. NBC_01796 TaxID=2975987 RepID=UPI002DD9BC33|nr:ATP-grasp domain-containing protein [Micromonospora sp. NBC_01796]WSA88567.1 ATP-grasp domain-containing protein [Micromonospora sp. NBC_01796]